jgi:tetratricopeptide (TPR) repeat protein
MKKDFWLFSQQRSLLTFALQRALCSSPIFVDVSGTTRSRSHGFETRASCHCVLYVGEVHKLFDRDEEKSRKVFFSKKRKNCMPRSQRNDNFIDKTVTVIADILLKILPTSQREKQAFTYYRDGMSAQAEGEYAEALQNYYEAMRLEVDAYDRSYILYNIGLIHTSNGEHGRALEYYYQALERNPSLPSALNNIAVIYHYRGEQAVENGQTEISQILFEKAADYWKEAIRLAPTNYIEAQNWLKMTGRNTGL